MLASNGQNSAGGDIDPVQLTNLFNQNVVDQSQMTGNAAMMGNIMNAGGAGSSTTPLKFKRKQPF